MKHLERAILIVLIFLQISCVKDLERNNPYDSHYTGSDKIEYREVVYFSHSVACKIIKYGPPYNEYGVEEEINAGDHIWLQVVVDNIGDYQINEIRGEISSESNSIQMIQFDPSYYISFESSLSNSESIPSGKTGYGVVKSGKNSYHPGAPNYNNYIAEFVVDSNIQIGTKIPFESFP